MMKTFTPSDLRKIQMIVLRGNVNLQENDDLTLLDGLRFLGGELLLQALDLLKYTLSRMEVNTIFFEMKSLTPEARELLAMRLRFERSTADIIIYHAGMSFTPARIPDELIVRVVRYYKRYGGTPSIIPFANLLCEIRKATEPKLRKAYRDGIQVLALAPFCRVLIEFLASPIRANGLTAIPIATALLHYLPECDIISFGEVIELTKKSLLQGGMAVGLWSQDDAMVEVVLEHDDVPVEYLREIFHDYFTDPSLYSDETRALITKMILENDERE